MTAYKRVTALEHVLVAERALGRTLPIGAEVHHVDGDGMNNAGTNLVICPSRAYHRLLHVRQRALDACGHGGWRKCPFCKRYDDTANMSHQQPRRNPSGGFVHAACKQAYQQQYRSAP